MTWRSSIHVTMNTRTVPYVGKFNTAVSCQNNRLKFLANFLLFLHLKAHVIDARTGGVGSQALFLLS